MVIYYITVYYIQCVGITKPVHNIRYNANEYTIAQNY